MKHPQRIRLCLAGLFAMMAGLSSATADVTIEQRMAVEGAGVMAMANMTGTTVTSISGDKSRTESDMQMQSRMVRMFSRGAGDADEIVRLDRDAVYALNSKQKEYSEISLADRRAQLADAMEQARQSQRQQPAATGMDESQCEWSEPKVELTRTGAKATIGGFDAEQTLITATQTCTDRKTGSVCDMALTLDEWFAPQFDGGGREALQFYRSYAERMGLGAAGSGNVQERAQALFGRYEGMWTQIAEKMAELKGYPVRSSFALGFGGAQCESARQASELPPPPPPGSLGTAVATAAGEAAGQAVGSKAGGSLLGGAAGRLGGRIAGSLWKKNKDKEQAGDATSASPSASPADSAPSANALITPLRVTSELVSVNTDPIPAAKFEVPPDFRKIAGK